MSGYIWMLLWLLIYTALSAVLEVQQSETVCGVQTVRFTKLWAALGVLPLLIFCTLRGDIGDDLQNLILGFLHIVALLGKEGVPLAHALIFLDRAEVRRTERGHAPAQLADLPPGLGKAFDGLTDFFRFRAAELVAVPEFFNDLALFHLRRHFLLFELGAAAFEIEQGAVLLLRGFVSGAAAASSFCRKSLASAHTGCSTCRVCFFISARSISTMMTSAARAQVFQL